MKFIFDRWKEICSHHKFVDTASKIMAYITPFIIMKEHLQLYANSFIPSYIVKIVHFDTKFAKINVKYVGRNNYYSIKNAHADMMDLSDNGYYLFHVWNKYKMKYEYYLLKANLLTLALGIRNMNYIWALHDYGIIQLLSNYYDYTLMGIDNKIIGITINHNDETKVFKPFMNSIHIPNNITPFILYMLSQYMKSEKLYYVDAKTTHCVYCDENLNEVCVKEAKEYLITSEQEMKCPLCYNISYNTHHDACSGSGSGSGERSGSYTLSETESEKFVEENKNNNDKDAKENEEVEEDEEVEEIFEVEGVNDTIQEKDKDV